MMNIREYIIQYHDTYAPKTPNSTSPFIFKNPKKLFF